MAESTLVQLNSKIMYVQCNTYVFNLLSLGRILIRDQPIMLIFSPIMLCCSAQKFYLLCSKLCSRIRIVLSVLSLFTYKFA